MSTSYPDAGRVIVHKHQQYAQASTGQRWWARIIDGAIIVLAASAFAAIGYASQPYSSAAAGMAVLFFVLAYIGATIVLGLLYGWGAGLGQMMTGVKSRRTRDGRRVGGFRGMLRYFGVAFLPFAIYLLFDAPTFWDDDIKVFKRRGQLLAQHQNSPRDPHHDARFTAPDPYQNGPRR
ncbi:RDD family protein [Agrococcus casei]|uniref:RDD family protein n=1 Tax=Agrococcus casei TaxID=343512 RepID=UPI003F8EE4F8